tara:strand:- start:842 stop:1588 length:747 start_codon:yes stop_codon:yes gene_type:complete
MHICIKSFIIFVSIFSAIEVSADTIDINKEIDLYALSKKYTKCTSSSYRDECYDLSRGNGFTREGYWRENKLWDGVYTDTTVNEIYATYFDGAEVYVGPSCPKNFQGWHVCRNGDKFKPVNGGTIDKNGKLQGEFIYKFSGGDVYEGNWENDVRRGYAKMTWYNEDVYEGNWENNLMHGYGKLTWADGETYQGNWENGAHHGYGKYTWLSGDVYEGNWKNDARHGYGKHTWADGETYQGEWRNGEMVD